jgi:hypothetical protein
MYKINLYGPPSVGKSMQSAFIFGKLKYLGHNAEMCSEYAKDLAWKKINIKEGGPTLQLEIFINQLKKEDLLKDKVDFMVTDSPLLLNAYYSQSELTKKIAIDRNNDKQFHFWLTRSSAKFEKAGRVHNEEESIQIEKDMKDYLTSCGVSLVVVDCAIEDRADWIIDYVLKQKAESEV